MNWIKDLNRPLKRRSVVIIIIIIIIVTFTERKPSKLADRSDADKPLCGPTHASSRTQTHTDNSATNRPRRAAAEQQHCREPS